jgi:hypothetical protein
VETYILLGKPRQRVHLPSDYLFPGNGYQHLKVELCGFRRQVIEALSQLDGQSLTLFWSSSFAPPSWSHRQRMIHPTNHILQMSSNSGSLDFNLFYPEPTSLKA